MCTNVYRVFLHLDPISSSAISATYPFAQPVSANLSQEDSHAVLESGTLLPRAYILILPSVCWALPPDTGMIHSLYLLQIFPPMPFLSEAFPRPHNAKLQVTLNPPMLYLLYSMHCHLTFVFYLLMYLFLQLSPPWHVSSLNTRIFNNLAHCSVLQT